jgi:hypothetical protein
MSLTLPPGDNSAQIVGRAILPGNLARSRLLGGFSGRRRVFVPRQRRLKAGCSQDWLQTVYPRQSKWHCGRTLCRKAPSRHGPSGQDPKGESP